MKIPIYTNDSHTPSLTLWSYTSSREDMNGHSSDEVRRYAGSVHLRCGDNWATGKSVGTIFFHLIYPNGMSDDAVLDAVYHQPPQMWLQMTMLQQYLKEPGFSLSDFQCLFLIDDVQIESEYNTPDVCRALASKLLILLHAANPLADHTAIIGTAHDYSALEAAGWDFPSTSLYAGYFYENECSLYPADPDSVKRTDTVLDWIRKHDSFCKQMSDIAASGAFSDKNSGETIHMLTALKDTKDELPSLTDVNWQRIARILRKETA